MHAEENEARVIEWKERPIVRVDAVVMVREEEGFTPHHGYGYSRVSIYESVSATDYLVYAHKIHDQKVTLDFLIPHRMSYTIASPIFHHWTVGEQRMGLSYNGTASARAFDRGIRVALESLEKIHAAMSSGSTSEETSPVSIRSFNLPTPDEPSSSESCLSPRQPPPIPPPTSQRISTTQLMEPGFRHQTLSASCLRVLPGDVPARPQRRHSSSVPGRPSPVVPPVPCTPPLSATAASTFPALSSHVATHADSSSKNMDPVKNSPSKSKPDCRIHSSVVASDGFALPPRHPRGVSQHRHLHHHRSKRTKTPNLDNLERQRDLQPTKLNSYVQLSSSKNNGLNHQLVQRQLAARLASSDDFRLSYNTSKLTVSPGVTNMHHYRYHGVRTTDESYWDFCGKTYPNYSSFHDANYASNLKQTVKNHEFSKVNGKRKEDLGERSRCRHCQAMYSHDENYRGSCSVAPSDSFERCIETTNCFSGPKYSCCRCLYNDECNCSHEPCRRHNGSRRRRCLMRCLLYAVFPCLCLYPVLKSCHRCGVRCHCCGGRHEPMAPLRENEASTDKI